jgi:hypothetical protein
MEKKIKENPMSKTPRYPGFVRSNKKKKKKREKFMKNQRGGKKKKRGVNPLSKFPPHEIFHEKIIKFFFFLS